MSRIGKKPVDVLDGVKVSLDGSTLNVEGPKGKLQWQVHPEVTVMVDEAAKSVKRHPTRRRAQQPRPAWTDSRCDQ